MSAEKHPITHHWIKQTLLPFLLYAFASTLPHPVDISEQIQRSIHFSLQKPDDPSDGDDLVFERIYMAIMHRHKNLAPDLEMVVDNLEPLAKYLIRRAQLKGPYELLGRSEVGSGDWTEYERYRLARLALEPEAANEELRPPVRPPTAPMKLPPADDEIDPRLVYAQQGHFAATDVSAQLTADEDSYYRRQNHDFEQYHLRNQQQQFYSPTVAAQTSDLSDNLLGTNYTEIPTTCALLYQRGQQQQLQRLSASTSMYIKQYAVPLRRTTPNPQSYPQTQDLQPQSALSSAFIEGISMQPYSGMQHTAQPQPGSHPSIQYQGVQHQPTHTPGAQQQPIQPTQPCPQHPQLPTLLPQAPAIYTPSLLPHPNLAPTQTRNMVQSSDFAHLRGVDWSTAAQQRAREIALRITAQERDSMAQDIIQRQQSLRKLAAMASRRGMYDPTKRVPDAPAQGLSARPQSAMAYGYPNARADADAAIVPLESAVHPAHAPANKGYEKPQPSNESSVGKLGVPTLAQVRSRYHPPQDLQGLQEEL